MPGKHNRSPPLEVLSFIHMWTNEDKKTSDRQVHSYLRQKLHHFHTTFQFGHVSKYCQRQCYVTALFLFFKLFTSSFSCLLEFICSNSVLLLDIPFHFKWKWKARHCRWMNRFCSSDKDAVVSALSIDRSGLWFCLFWSCGLQTRNTLFQVLHQNQQSLFCASSQLLTINLSALDIYNGRSVKEGKDHTKQEQILHFRSK